MPSFSESIFLFVLALLLFGPKKLPVLARELGKWMGEFRRASNEFKMQMEEELRAAEQADRQKQIAAMEAAAPVTPPLSEPAATHLNVDSAITPAEPSLLEIEPPKPDRYQREEGADSTLTSPGTADGAHPLPIATSGSLRMMPPDTGLPTPRSTSTSALSPLVDAIPEASPDTAHAAHTSGESISHGD